MNIVWFKKDLRAFDHAALAYSLEKGKTIGLFIFEPEWFTSVEFDQIHLKFVIESVSDLKNALAIKKIPLIIRNQSALSTFEDLNRTHKVTSINSHQETGLQWTYDRDLKVKKWAEVNSIPWTEFKQFGVIRKLKNRETWTEKRKAIVNRKIIFVGGQPEIVSPWGTGNIPTDLLIGTDALKNKNLQIGGRQKAMHTLQSFVNLRSENYSASISSPIKAFKGCSRLSPYITWGNLTLSEIEWATQQKKMELEKFSNNSWWIKSIEQFESRLWWHCHFIQKLETEPEIEFQNFNREFDGLRENDFDESKFQAWCKGETGFPMIDACMKALLQNGWINFRMRAMLLSFATYQLWLHWKRPAEFLARKFLDFEPGIHYSQVQMQAGVTGINTIRIYSPKKQLLDQDPQGIFVKKYLPELENVSLSDLAEPHLMPPFLQIESGYKPGLTYPEPIVNPEKSYQIAKQKMFEWKKQPEVKKMSEKILLKHVSRNKNFTIKT